MYVHLAALLAIVNSNV